MRNHKNKRKGLGDEEEPGYAGCGHKSSSGKTTGVAATGYGGRPMSQLLRSMIVLFLDVQISHMEVTLVRLLATH